MNAHTPGPWIACERGDYSDYDGNSAVIISSSELIRVAVVHHRGTADADANARLIAASPDLLSAAILAVKEFENEGQVFRDAISALKRAIGLAEGGNR